MTHSVLSRLFSAFCLLATLAVSVPAASPARATGAQAGTWYVATTGSDGNDCATPATPCATINAAIGKAAEGDIIKIAIGTYFGTGSQVVFLDKALTLSGGWNTEFSTQTGLSTIDGQEARRGLWISVSGDAQIERVRVENGAPRDYQDGGGLHIATGTVSVRNAYVTNNSSVIYVGGGQGGGISISQDSTLILENCAISYNRASISGGGIHNEGSLLASNVTISSNQVGVAGWSGGNGGGAIAINGGSAIVSNSTITGNSIIGSFSATAIWSAMAGGAFQYRNTIIVENGAHYRECWQAFPGAIVSLGHNVVSDGANCGAQPGADIVDADPLLLPLQTENTLIPVHALAPGSVAINGGSPAGCLGATGQPLNDDARGFPRLGRCDIGAYEAGLAMQKAVIGRLAPGGRATYTLTLSNDEGQANLSGVVVTDTLPGGTVYLPNTLSATAGAAYANGNVIAWAGAVSGATPVIIQFQASINPDTLGHTITNTAESSWHGFGQVASAGFLSTHSVHIPLVNRNYCADFFDDFSQPTARWYQGDDDLLAAQITGGEYRLYTKVSDIFLVAAPTCPREHYTVETDVRWAAPSGNSYGLLFGLNSDWSRFYFLDVNPYFQGFRLFRYDDASGFSLIAGPAIASDTINSGIFLNRLSVMRYADRIYAYSNGFLLGSWADTTSLGLTRAGVMVLSYDGEPVADARFDNFRVTGLAASPFAAGAPDTGLPSLLLAEPARRLPAGADWPWPTFDQIKRAFETR